MDSPETRSIKQCTYTTAKLDDTASSALRSPLLKRAVLLSAFQSPLSALVLERMSRTDPAIPLPPNAKELTVAVHAAQRGDFQGSAAAVAPISFEEIERFTDAAFIAENALIAESEQLLTGLSAAQRLSNASPAAPIATPIADSPSAVHVPTTAAATHVVPAPADNPWEELQREAPRVGKVLHALGCIATAVPIDAWAKPRECIEHARADLERRRQRRHLLSRRVQPIGWLQLERLKFTPLGFARGDLVYSLPMLPHETVRLTHRDWSRSESEYTKMVSTSLETASQEALSEKTELTESFATQSQRSSSLNASASGSGGFGPIVSVTASASANFSTAQSESQQTSAKQAQELTKSAASRSKQEMKMTFRVTTIQETEDTSFRELRNDTDAALRWDFHRLMKKWQVDLYRYDARLTYDVVVPEPGSYLLRKYIEVTRLRRALEQPLAFSLTPGQINETNWLSLSAQYRVQLDPPPQATIYVYAHAEKPFASRIIGYDYLELSLPEGYVFDDWGSTGSNFNVAGGLPHEGPGRAGYIDPLYVENSAALNAGARTHNRFLWRYLYDWSEPREAERGSVLSVSAWARGRISVRAWSAWQASAHRRLFESAQAQHEAMQRGLQQQLDALMEDLSREDGLVLRRIEKEEIMKAVLRWVLGPAFRFYPQDLPTLHGADGPPADDIEYYDARTEAVLERTYVRTLEHGEMIRFLHQAVEWENVTYVLYPYFWTDDSRWELKQPLFHHDDVHRAFLRSGAARVVLPIRPNWEKAFLTFVETLDLSAALEESHPYMRLADEFRASSEALYPYTENATEERESNRVARWFEFTPTSALDVRRGETLGDG